ncbi:hypothetical protein QF032_006710 [Streptomyces achromogenes]|uniref:Uncharacterized protein n=1 Tax=Streptomyces achromogenes TaxID=67255 RepID=A0ABU0QAI0_STRAH|nr:hypothetical protein [Streptomyces achromogenes]MDQ0834866.1 hypothetical protein [Streptomyces achromogenes]
MITWADGGGNGDAGKSSQNGKSVAAGPVRPEEGAKVA